MLKLRYGTGGWHESEHEPFGRIRYIVSAYILGREFPGDRLARARAVWHSFVLRYDGEICGRCGRPVARGIGTWWEAPDELWLQITGRPEGVLCPACFDVLCIAKGIYIHFVARTENATELYFWSAEWQDQEREFEADRKAGRLIRAESMAEVIRDLEEHDRPGA